MSYTLSPGHRVTWCHDFTETKAQITRVWKNKAEILTTDFQKIKVPLDELELVPLAKTRNNGIRDFLLGSKVFCQAKQQPGTVIQNNLLSTLVEWDNLTEQSEWVLKSDLVESDPSVREQNPCTLTDFLDEGKNGCTLTEPNETLILSGNESVLLAVIDDSSITPRVIENKTSITPRVIENKTSITPRVIENPSGTIGQYRKGENFYWRYSYRQGRHKSIHKHIGKVGCAKADCMADEIKALIEDDFPIEEILRIL